MADGEISVAWESNSYPKPKRAAGGHSPRHQGQGPGGGSRKSTYYLKVEAYDADGALLTSPRRAGEGGEKSRPENESEQFHRALR